MNNGVFGKTMESLRKYKDINFAKPENTKNYLVSEPNYQTTSSLQKMCWQ